MALERVLSFGSCQFQIHYSCQFQIHYNNKLAIMEMSKKCLLDICKEQRLYRTPSLNDKLYLNFKGFVNIGNLEEYVNVRAIFLEGNAISSLEGLPPLKELRCL